MKKEIINFDEIEYNKEISRVKNLVKKINDVIPELMKFEDQVTLEMIQKIIFESEYISKERYNERIKMYCKQFSLNPDKLNFTDHEFIFKLANTAIQYLFDAKREIGFLGYYDTYLFTEGVISFENDQVHLTENWEKIIKEKHTYFTETDSENEIIKDSLEVVRLLNKIASKMGKSQFNLTNIFDYYQYNNYYKLNVSKFRHIAKLIK